MTKLRFLLCLSALAGGSFGLPSASAARPNVILITADDAGMQLGCYGDTTIPTPNLDRLASEGVRFERAFVTVSSCSPSRAVMLTGRYSFQNGQIGLSHQGFQMNAGEVGFPQRLKNAGYRTGVIGKLHVQPFNQLGIDFKEGGFDFPAAQRWTAESTRDVVRTADTAKQFILDGGTKSFFLMINYLDPHEPFLAQYKGRPANPVGADDVEIFPFMNLETTQTRLETTAKFYNCMQRLDDGIGLLMDALREIGQADNTLIVFLSDHGPPFIRAKTTCYEAGLQVPFIVRWPGTAQPGLVRPEMVSSLDIMPTILQAAGVSLPNNLQGRSLLPLLRGDPAPVDWRTRIYGEMNFHGPTKLLPMRSVRDDRYKLIENYQPLLTGTEFFDLQNDPYELNNLAGQPAYAAEQARLRQELKAWRKATNDPLLKESTIVDWVQIMRQATGYPATDYGNWKRAQFTSTQLSDPAVGGGLADPDEDGRVNVAEYALGSQPLRSDPGAGFGSGLQDGMVAFTFDRRVADPYTMYLPQSSTDLVTWEEDEALFKQLSVTDLGNGLERVTISPTESGDSHFFRLRLRLLITP